MSLQQTIMLALKVSILTTVFAFGLLATIGDMLYVVRRPSLLGRSLLAMFVIMPIIAIAIDKVFTLPSAVEIALVALAISPIPPLLPQRETRAGGHASFALGLMAIVAMLSIVIVPAAINLVGRVADRPLAMSSGAVAKLALTMAILPLAAGLLFHAVWPSVAVRIVKPVALVAKVLLTVGILGLLAGTLPSILALIGDGRVLALAAFIIVGLAVGHWLGGPESANRPVLAISTASRHPAIALAVAKANFPDEPYLGATILLYLLVNLLVAIPYQSWQKRRNATTPVFVVAVACSTALLAASPTFISTWKAPGTAPLDFAGKRVAALVITSDDNLRMSAEVALAREITARGPVGVAAYRVIPREELTDKDKAKRWFDQYAVAGVVAMRMVGADQSTSYSGVVWSSGYYSNLWDYYGNGWATVIPIGKSRLDTTLAVETLLYQVSDGKLLWAGISETTNPKDTGTFMKGLVDAAVKELQKEGLVGKAPK